MSVSLNSGTPTDTGTASAVQTISNATFSLSAGSNVIGVAALMLYDVTGAGTAATSVACTWGGSSMSLFNSYVLTGTYYGSIYIFFHPLGTASANTPTVTGTWGTASLATYLVAFALNGASQTTPFGGFVTATQNSISTSSIAISGGSTSGMLFAFGQSYTAAGDAAYASMISGEGTLLNDDDTYSQNIWSGYLSAVVSGTIGFNTTNTTPTMITGFYASPASTSSTCQPGSILTMGVGCSMFDVGAAMRVGAAFWAAKKVQENPIMSRRGLILPRRRSLSNAP